MYFVIAIAALIIVLVCVLLARAFSFGGRARAERPEIIEVNGEETAAAQKLSEAVRIKTVSHMDASLTDGNGFKRFEKLLERQFPEVHKTCEKTVINGYSLVFRWKGADPAKKPGLITAHIDVVPVESDTEKDWEHPPFSGDIAEGFVWGRGTLDTKIHVIAALEAAEQLIREGFVPERDIWFAFGHDEEVGGLEGALAIAGYFKDKGLEFEYVLDEGGFIGDNVVDGVSVPIAMIGTGEKGYANIKLTFHGDGGHSARPPVHSALGFAAQTVVALEKHQCRVRLIEPSRIFLMNIGPRMKLANRLILANLWLFKPLFLSIFSKGRSGNAMLRTTTAATMAEAGMAPNVLPQKASVIVNFRILPGETGEDLLNHIRKALKGVKADIEPINLDEPSAVSSCDSEAYKTIAGIVEQLCEDVAVVPYIVLASTDARKYEPVCKNIYRFTPYRVDNSDLDRMHGTNERISLRNVNMSVEFFRRFFIK